MLTVRTVETLGPGRYVDGRGLMLVVKPGGARSWIHRIQVDGRRRDLGLGAYPTVSLREAREKRDENHRRVARGEALDQPKTQMLTFKAAAEALLAAKSPSWRNDKHRAQWSSTLIQYAYPHLGNRHVALVDTQRVLLALRPIWQTKPETASRVRQRIEAVLDYATSIGARSGDNPARWRGHLSHLLAAPNKVRAVRHHAALSWRMVPRLMRQLDGSQGAGARALRFTILTAARSGEVRGMRWREVDGGIWTIPGSRMKAGKEHRVPLTKEAFACLGEPGNPEDLVFHGADPEKPLSDMTLAKALKTTTTAAATVHGFRSSFRDWAGETTHHAREVIEAALAHRLKDKAEASYARGDLFTKRRRLMDDWSEFLKASSDKDI